MLSEHEHVTRREFYEAIAEINERINDTIMATQADIDALATELGTVSTDIQQVSTDLSTSTQTIQAEIDKLAAANPTVDVTALKAAADALDPAVKTLDQAAVAVGSLAPTPAPAPTPTPTPAGPTKSVYTFSGDPTTIDATVWSASGFETTETPPRLLYYFSGDTAPGDTNGNGQDGGAWVVYTGPTQAAA